MNKMIPSTVMAVAMLAATEAWGQEVEITIDPIASITESGAQARLTGTVTCPEGWSGFLDVELVQIQKGGKIITGDFEGQQLECSGVVQDWEFILFTSIPFKPGPATAQAFSVVFDPVNPGEAFDQTAEAVKIQRAR